MPLMFVESVAPDVMLGVWRIEESVEEFFSIVPGLKDVREEVGRLKSVQRRLEVLAVRSLLGLIVGDGVVLLHDADGKPLLENGMNVGISHTKGCAAVIVSSCRDVAVDVEYMSGRVERVVGKLLRDDETALTLLDKLLHWCAKETMYKLYPKDHLALADICVSAISGDSMGGRIIAKNVQRDDTLNVVYRVFDGYMLTYAVL